MRPRKEPPAIHATVAGDVRGWDLTEKMGRLSGGEDIIKCSDKWTLEQQMYSRASMLAHEAQNGMTRMLSVLKMWTCQLFANQSRIAIHDSDIWGRET